MSAPRPLIVTNDSDVLDDLLRLAAAADVEVDVAVDLVAARPQWTRAPLVLLGADSMTSARIPRPPARTGVMLICRGGPALDSSGSATDVGVESIATLPEDEEAVVRRLVESAGPPDEARTVGVVGGCGGAGASVLATALASTAARCGRQPLLVDLDPLGGGLDVLLGLEQQVGLRWSDLAAASGRLSPSALRDALPRAGGLAVLSHGRRAGPVPAADAVLDVLDACRRCADPVVVDLPRSSAPPAVGVLDELAVVVPGDVRAVAAALPLVDSLTASARSIGVVVRHLPASTLSAEHVADALSLVLLGELRAEPGLPAALHSGRPFRIRRRGPLATLCERLLERQPASELAA